MPLSLAIPPWVSAMSMCDGFMKKLGENGKFCIANRTAGILA